jgi:hypothetical protein
MTTEIDRAGCDMRAGEPETSWTRLDAELRMICRSLVRPAGWMPEAVTTFVRLPGDAEYRQAIGTLCCRLAAEHGLEQTVRRQGDDWCVRFARPVVAGPVVVARGVPGAVPVGAGLRGAIGRASAMARQLVGLEAWRQREILREC